MTQSPTPKSLITSKVKVLLDIDNTTLYDSKLNILVNGGISKLTNEGIPFEFTVEEFANNVPEIDDYAICLSYQVAIDLDLDVDLNRLQSMYLSRAITLRKSNVE